MGGWGNGELHIVPNLSPPQKQLQQKGQRAPGSCKPHPGEKGRSSRHPLLGPHPRGLANKKGDSGGWTCPPLLRALTPGKKAAHPALALQEMLGGPRGEKLFPPLRIPFVAKILNSLLPTPLQAMADGAVALLRWEVPDWEVRNAQAQLGQDPSSTVHHQPRQ